MTTYPLIAITVNFVPENLDTDNPVLRLDAETYAHLCARAIESAYPGASVSVSTALESSVTVESARDETTDEIQYSVRAIIDRVYQEGKFWS